MSKDSLMVKQITFIVVVQRIKTLGIAITVGIIAIYIFGLFVANKNIVQDFDVVNLLTLIILMFSVPLTLFVKKLLMRRVNITNFAGTYFSAHLIPFAIMDFAALFCITTNLFVNGNILYASIGIVISIAGMLLNFPKEKDFEKIKSEPSITDRELS